MAVLTCGTPVRFPTARREMLFPGTATELSAGGVRINHRPTSHCTGFTDCRDRMIDGDSALTFLEMLPRRPGIERRPVPSR